MIGNCEICNAEVFSVARDGLCPRCRHMRDKKEVKAHQSQREVPEMTFIPLNIEDQPKTTPSHTNTVLFLELPRECPDCQKPFPATDRPERHLSTMAKLIILIGTVASLLFAGFMITLVDDLVVFRDQRLMAAWICLQCWPGIVAAYLAYRLEKVVPMRCRACGWKKQFVIKKAY